MEENRNCRPVRVIDAAGLLKLLPHRHPFLLVDRVEILEEGRLCAGYKCVSANETFFQGHFPGRPIMPGVLMLEGMAQTAGAMLADGEGRMGFFAAVKSARFRKIICPGEVLVYRVELLKARSGIVQVAAEASCGLGTAAEAELTFALEKK